jgi:hypothetical protein
VGRIHTSFFTAGGKSGRRGYGVQGNGKEAGFDAHWALRKERAFCAS